MPELDGYRAPRGDPRRRRVSRTLPVIAMTAHAMAEERERCLAAGMNDHVSKPIEPEVLYQTLARWFRRGAKPGRRRAGEAAAGRRGRGQRRSRPSPAWTPRAA